MRTLCDSCDSAAAIVFCAADQAALCRACDDKVHMCNKLASRHVRVGLAEPNDFPRCDICENSPAFFYCEVDGSSLCLECDMTVHVGGKRSHGRYLLLRQRVEFPGDKPGHIEDMAMQPMEAGVIRREQNHSPRPTTRAKYQNHRVSPVPVLDANDDHEDGKMIDLNTRPRQICVQGSNNQRMDVSSSSDRESARVVPVGSCEREAEK